MARWKLTQKHYLNVPGTEWTYTESPMGSRRQIRRVFQVPRYLDPEDPADCNYNPNGLPRRTIDGDRGDPREIIVCHRDKGQADDIVFTGPPTLDMTPLDDEAREISEEMSKSWGRQFLGIDSEGGYAGALLLEMTQSLSTIGTHMARPSGYVPNEEAAALAKSQAEQITKLIEMNMALIAKLDRGESPPSTSSLRRA